MPITHQITRAVTAGGSSISKAQAISAGQESNLDEVIPNGSTDLAVTFAADQSEMKSFFMVADRAMTVKTNSSSTPADTFTLVANIPRVWTTSDGGANPVTVDITSLFVTNSSGASGTLQIRMLVDPTP